MIFEEHPLFYGPDLSTKKNIAVSKLKDRETEDYEIPFDELIFNM